MRGPCCSVPHSTPCRRRPSPTDRHPTVDRTGCTASPHRHPAVRESTRDVECGTPGIRSLRLADLCSWFDPHMTRGRCLFHLAYDGPLLTPATAARITSPAALASRATASTGTNAVTKTTAKSRTGVAGMMLRRNRLALSERRQCLACIAADGVAH